MEQTVSELAVNDVYDEKLEKKPCDTIVKPENQNHFGSLMMRCVSTRRDSPESLRRENNAQVEDTGRHDSSTSGCAPLCNGLHSLLAPEDSKAETPEYTNLTLASSQYRARKGSWNYFYYLDSDSRFHSLNTEVVAQEEQHLRVGREVQRVFPDAIPRPYASKTVYHDQHRGKKTMLSDTFHETKFTPRNSEASGIHNRKLGIEENGNLDCTNEIRTNTSVESYSKDKNHMPGMECVGEAMDLRKWITSMDRIVNKAKSLYIFKQIVELVDSAHAQGVVLLELRPSLFILFPSNRVKYIGSSSKERNQSNMTCNFTKKRAVEDYVIAPHCPTTKQQKLCQETIALRQHSSSTCISDFQSKTSKANDSHAISHSSTQNISRDNSPCQNISDKVKQSMILPFKLEEELYSNPEELRCKDCTSLSNMYSLGILLFELLCEMESPQMHAAIMMDLHLRILPPKFLSENPTESGFCLWLLHPEPSSRPTTRMILQSELLCGFEEPSSGGNAFISNENDGEDALDQLLCFLEKLKESKRHQASKVAEELGFLEADINEIQRRHFVETRSISPQAQKEIPVLREKDFLIKNHASEIVRYSVVRPNTDEARWKQNIAKVEDAYFSIRSQILLKERNAGPLSGNHIQAFRDNPNCQMQNVDQRPRRTQKSADSLGYFYEGLCKFARYRKFEVLGTIRNADLLNSANVICSLDFDRDEEYIAAAGISKKIKIFEFSSISSDSVDVHYPIVEMSNKSKISCVCWNNYIQSYLASTDYDGVVQIWDANTGQGFSQYMEHQKRAWSIDFCQANPTMFASGSDDCSVKLWSIKERSSLCTIWSPANVCCVQFSGYLKNLLVFGSSDYKIYGYDMRHTRIPWCTLAGHEKAVSYVKFLDADTLVSASTDNSLRLWNLNKTTSDEESTGACGLTFKGHSNEKNFVGLSSFDGYIACGSETNEVYCYSRSLPVPITSHRFGSTDPISGTETSDNNGQFVSSVCWRQKSNTIVAANSSGIMKLLQMV